MPKKKTAAAKGASKTSNPASSDGKSAAPAEAAPSAHDQTSAAQLNVLAQFIKDLSFESPNSPGSLQGPGENPKLEVNVNVQGRKQSDNVYEVALYFDAKAINDTGVIYNVELVYAGLFRLTNIPEHLLQAVLFIDCPAVLFPFMRRIVADLTREGSFPPLFLDPIDFASLYQKNAAQQTGAQSVAPQQATSQSVAPTTKA